MNLKIVSGGQTGVDRAALDVALKLKIPCGGWCPKNRKAEDGVIDKKYPLQETPKQSYAQRTLWNVRDSDGTLLLTWGKPKGGTLLTQQFAHRLKKPIYVVDFEQSTSPHLQDIINWRHENQIKVLNIAGPRASFDHNIYTQSYQLITNIVVVMRATKLKMF